MADVFAHDSHCTFFLRSQHACQPAAVVRQVQRAFREMQQLQHLAIKILPCQFKGNFVNGIFDIQFLNAIAFRNIAETGEFLQVFRCQRHFTAADQQIGNDPDPPQSGCRMLCRFGFKFFGTPDIGYQCQMNKNHITGGSFQFELSGSFEERQTFDIAAGAADFGYGYIDLL